MAEPFPTKPKGMHWRTYRRLVDQYEEADGRAIPPFLLKLLYPRDQQSRISSVPNRRNCRWPKNARRIH